MDKPTEAAVTSGSETKTESTAAAPSAETTESTPTAETMIADGLAKPPTTKTAAETTESTPTAETKPAAETKAPAKATPSLEERLAKLELEYSSKTQRTEGEFARLEYMHDKCGDIPRELALAFLPATTDVKELDKAHSRLLRGLGDYVKSCIRRGVLKAVDLGGSAGGESVSLSETSGAQKTETPASLIADGLGVRR